MSKFVKKKTYYVGEVYEYNLPTGTTCPFAMECKVVVDKVTGKFDVTKGQYRCYASSAERFPAVRNHRHNNFDFVKNGGVPTIPKECKAIRIHSSGDFFNQSYFDMWLKLAKDNPSIEMWAYTKSLSYWVNRLNDIPNNLILTASYGGKTDSLIEKFSLKNVKVYASIEEVPKNRPIDTNDKFARIPNINFALLDNMKYSKKQTI
tara:strand:+ start:289 stop:903 length:615 start_codon:yes stop_codon:yes gene_type:complete